MRSLEIREVESLRCSVRVNLDVYFEYNDLLSYFLCCFSNGSFVEIYLTLFLSFHKYCIINNSQYTPMEGSISEVKENFRPLKRYFRQRAHCNPLSHNDTFS